MHTNERRKPRLGAELVCISDFQLSVAPPQPDEDLVNASEALHCVLIRVPTVAISDCSVLITGEAGTGTELIAKTIHRLSGRSAQPFVRVNCALIPPWLIASELLGSFPISRRLTAQPHRGRFAQAEGGTLFLEGIGELSLESQLALVRVLEDLESELDGREQSTRPDVRLIAAIHRDLQIANAKGTFLSELFCRLNVFPIMVPSLRERREDIPRLAWHFLTYYAEREGKRLPALTGSVMHLLKSYPWPATCESCRG